MRPELSFIAIKKDTFLRGREPVQRRIAVGEVTEALDNVQVTLRRFLNEMKYLLVTQCAEELNRANLVRQRRGRFLG